MRRALGAVAFSALLFAGCGGGGSSGPTTTLERDRDVSDNEITRATADLALRCTAALAELMHFDPSWITSSTPPETVAPVDPDLLDVAQEECDATQEAVAADLDPVAGVGWNLEMLTMLEFVAEELHAPEVNLAPDTGLAMTMLNLQGIVTGEFESRNPLVIT